jgi:hypothetical protein
MLLPLLVITFVSLCAPLCGQEAVSNGTAAPSITGTGQTNHIPVWKSSTTLGSSGIVSASGNVGIGTSSPVAKLEVSGDAQVDGNFTLSGRIQVTGVGQLLWAPNDGSGNFSAGLGALPSTTTGTLSTAVGDGALQVNSTGGGNTAIGYNALVANSGGANNTASGADALFSNTTACCNTATGSVALYSNSTGANNTASGDAALFSNSTGGGNTAAGEAALYSNTSGSNNIAIGYIAGFNVINTSNNIHIGNLGAANDNGMIRIGTAGVQTSAFIAGIYGTTTGFPGGVNVLIDSAGQLGTMSSSRRYKEDIAEMGDASSGLMRLRPVTFRYKKPFDDNSKPIQYGLIAEEVAEVYPDLVARSADGQIETVKYQVLDSMLLNELQKQNATITAQKEQIRSLEERLARIEAALSGTTVTASAR